ncbi:MAG: thiamine pyrophosphate-binding protein, partial [Chloroflexi bacterium]|nr:thiamine pyrophosphate-binding protein [Chloroflexota bacterium]
MTGADAVAQILKREGIEYLFCFPTTPIIEACARVGIRPIITRTERTLINMADGYSRVSNGNRLGVCAVQYGPGLENAFGGIAQAYADSSPILVLPLTEYQSFADTKPAFGAVEHFRGITKWVGMVNRRDRLSQFMRRAFTLLRTGHGAPVVVEIPRELATSDYPSNELDYQPVPAMRTMADPDSIESAADLLATARRPCIIAGQGVLYAGATAELVELAEMLDAPVATSLMAKSAFPETHPLSLGVANRSDSIPGRFLERSDVILAIGASLSEGLMLAPLPTGKRLIHSTVNEYDIGKTYPAAVPLLSDAGLVTRQLLAALRDRPSGITKSPRASIRREIEAERQSVLERWLPVFTSDDQPIRPYRIMWDLNNLVDRDNTIVTHDSGMP